MRVEERRLPFDFTAYVETVPAVTAVPGGAVWSRVIARQLSQSRDCLVFFLQFVERYAQQIGDDAALCTGDLGTGVCPLGKRDFALNIGLYDGSIAKRTGLCTLESKEVRP